MTITEQNFVTIMKHVCHPEIDVTLQEPINFNELFQLASKHNVLPLVYEFLKEENYIAVNDPKYAKIKMASLKQIVYQGKRTEAFLEIYQKFIDNDLHPIVMKGIICRQLYGDKANLRPSTDEDILIDPKDFETYRKVLEENGYVCERERVTEKQLKYVQEVTFENKEKQLKIEMHINAFRNGDNFFLNFNQYISSSDYIETKYINSSNIPISIRTLTYTRHLLYLIFHAYKHITGSGLGIRQLLDILLFLNIYKNEIDFNYVTNVLTQNNIVQIYTDFLFIGNYYLGFNFNITSPKLDPDFLLSDLLSNGVFGTSSEAQIASRYLTRSSLETNTSYLSAIFPRRISMIDRYPLLVDYPFFLPFCWMHRWLIFFQRNRKSQNSLAKESHSISQKRVTMLKKYIKK